jgi:hypothetical protein
MPPSGGDSPSSQQGADGYEPAEDGGWEQARALHRWLLLTGARGGVAHPSNGTRRPRDWTRAGPSRSLSLKAQRVAAAVRKATGTPTEAAVAERAGKATPNASSRRAPSPESLRAAVWPPPARRAAAAAAVIYSCRRPALNEARAPPFLAGTAGGSR